jgi:POT family proton-dependent oligopeptide transporter
MGTWFFASATGNFAAGLIASATGGHEGTATRESVLAVYSNVGWLGVGVGVAVLAVSPFIKRLMHLDTLQDDAIAGAAEVGEPQAAGMHPEGSIGKAN